MTKLRLTITRLLSRWLWIAVMLGLIGSMSPTRLTQAAPTRATNLSIWLYARKVRGEQTICVGDQVVIEVRVVQRVGSEGDYRLGDLIGVEVGAFLDGSGVGTIAPANTTTRMNSLPTGAASFTFSAEKTGTTLVVFQGVLNTRVIGGIVLNQTTLTASVPITVENCQYTVTAFSRWRVPGEANLNIVARIHNAGMTEDGGGHYKGTANVTWLIIGDPVGDCTSTITALPSQAELDGQVYGPEEFRVSVTYQAASVTLNDDCRGTGGAMQVQITPDPLTISVPTTGGSNRQTQLLQGPGADPSYTLYIVSRKTGQ